jgi:HEPN domain-containing protein
MKNPQAVKDWLRRARSSFARARAGRVSDEIMLEDMCFDIQQSAEKAVKAVLISQGMPLPRTHNISHILDLLENNGILIPDEVQNARMLTGYAVEIRYPGDYEPLTEEEYKASLEILEKLLQWAESLCRLE